MKIGIIGLPQSGKTTIFNAAAGKTETVGDYSKASHRAIVKVPDERLDKLCEMVNPKKKTYAEIEYLDICALSGKGKAADAAALEVPDDLRYADALMVVIDCFGTDCAPQRDLQLFIDEIILSDQIIIERNLEKKDRLAKLTGDQEAALEAQVLTKSLASLEKGEPLIFVGFGDDDAKILRKYSFLSLKPLLVVLNIGEKELGHEDEWVNRFTDMTVAGAREFVALCGKIEMELAALNADDQAAFMKELGIERPAMELLIQKSYALLGLISFLTVGEPEGRAWTIPRGTHARKAAGAIHSDIERGFIRAEIVTAADYIQYGSVHAAKEVGKFRIEGKDYIVDDGDVILFRFNI